MGGSVTRQRGERGEDIAAAYLKKRGYRIVDRNWSVRGRGGKLLGEVDIIARKGGDVIFVEVKAGTGEDAAFRPELHVGREKAARLKRTARAWLTRHRSLDAPWQIDVIAVDFPRGGPPFDSAQGKPRVRHIPYAITDDNS